MTPTYTYLSLGAGVQSSALLVLAATGADGVPRPDVAVFADTGDEPAWVYAHLGTLTAWAAARGVRVDTCRAPGGPLSVALAEKMRRWRFVAIPAFTSDAAGRPTMLMRQCTREYKLDPIKRHVRGLLGLRKRERAAGRVRVRALIGISADEAQRMKPSRDAWIENVYPLVDLGLRRRDCEAIVVGAGLPRPRKSACRFCPFHDDRYWLALRTEAPEEFEAAACVDDAIRDGTATGITRPIFLHRSLRPLREVDFAARVHGHARQGMLFDDAVAGRGFGGECEGMCGV